MQASDSMHFTLRHPASLIISYVCGTVMLHVFDHFVSSSQESREVGRTLVLLASQV